VILIAMFAASMMLAETTPAAATAAAAAPTAAAPAAPAVAAKKDEKPRLICKTEAVTGSLFPKKTCYTSDQLAQRQQDERQNLEKIQNNLAIKSN
jgi:invasion protein IalB